MYEVTDKYAFYFTTHILDIEPVGQISGVGEGGGQTHHSDLVTSIRGDEVSSWYDHLQHGTSVSTYTRPVKDIKYPTTTNEWKYSIDGSTCTSTSIDLSTE